MRAGRRKKTAESADHAESYARKCLGSLARILVHSGHSPAALVQEFIDVCRELGPSRQAWDDEHLAYMSDLGHVMTHWHSHPKFLAEDGTPLPLPLKGPGESLYGLIARSLPERDPEAVAKSLEELKGIRPQGSRFVPTARYLTFREHLDSGRHGLMALLGMLETVEHNAFSRAGEPKRIERTAINPRFPVAAIPAFRKRLDELIQEFLSVVDEEMTQKEATKSSRRSKRFGVAVCELGDISAGNRFSEKKSDESRGRGDRGRRRTVARR